MWGGKQVELPRFRGGLAEVIGHFSDIELPAYYHQNLGIFWEFWLFQKKNFGPKKDPTAFKSLFGNTMGNLFFDFLKY